MKKLVYVITSIIFCSVISCKKNTEGNKNVLIKDSVEKNGSATNMNSEQTGRYVAEDGSATLVTFKNNNGEKSIEIASNKMTIKAPMTDKEGIYEDYNYKISAKNDSVTITQGDNVIQLKKARGNQGIGESVDWRIGEFRKSRKVIQIASLLAMTSV